MPRKDIPAGPSQIWPIVPLILVCCVYYISPQGMAQVWSRPPSSLAGSSRPVSGSDPGKRLGTRTPVSAAVDYWTVRISRLSMYVTVCERFLVKFAIFRTFLHEILVCH